MRLPIHKIYRAFPELDHFDDGACEQFISEVRSRKWQRLARFMLTVITGLGSLIGAGFLSGVTFSYLEHARFVDELHEGLQVILFLSLALFFCLLAFLPAILLRDFLLRRQIRRVLRNGCCRHCGYALIGQPVSAENVVTCSECGKPTDVDPSLGHLTRTHAGRTEYAGRAEIRNQTGSQRSHLPSAE